MANDPREGYKIPIQMAVPNKSISVTWLESTRSPNAVETLRNTDKRGNQWLSCVRKTSVSYGPPVLRTFSFSLFPVVQRRNEDQSSLA